MGSLVGVILGGVLLSTLVASGTSWYLSLQNSTIKTEERMQAQSYAFNEWQLVLAEDYGNVTSKSRKTVSDKYDLVREVGAEKTVSGSGKEKDVTITVYKKGTNEVAYALASAKAKPSLDEYFTKAQINSLLASLKTDYTNKINAEASERANKDTELATKINNEATARANKDTDLQNQINNLKNQLANNGSNGQDGKSGCTITSIYENYGTTNMWNGGSGVTGYDITFVCPSEITFSGARLPTSKIKSFIIYGGLPSSSGFYVKKVY